MAFVALPFSRWDNWQPSYRPVEFIRIHNIISSSILTQLSLHHIVTQSLTSVSRSLAWDGDFRQLHADNTPRLSPLY